MKRETILQRAAVNSLSVNEVPPIVHEVLLSPGQPLDAVTRAFMEPRFGDEFSQVRTHAPGTAPIPARLSIGPPHDYFEQEAEQMAQHVISRQAISSANRYEFSGVRIHTDEKAAESAHAVNAFAYTVGHDIVFGTRQFQPATHEGKKLLAHELAHVLQQERAGYPSRVIERMPAVNDDCTADTDPQPVPSMSEFATNEELRIIRISVFLRQSPRLKYGDSGPAVALVQRLLLNTVCAEIDRNALKNELAKEKFGSVTRMAVQLFQRNHTDAIGRQLEDDGSVGPLTLGAMDNEVGLAPLPPARAPEGKGDCYGTAEDGPGEVTILSQQQASVSPVPNVFPSEAVWELWNFDIAKHFVKTEHRIFLRNVAIKIINATPIDKYLVRIIGEASTTAGQSFNLPLSKARAHCVRDALLEAGLDSEARLMPDVGYGETYAQIRRVRSNTTTIDQVEDPIARKVSIVLAPRISDDCPLNVKTRASRSFLARVACASATMVRINIGDTSDVHWPIYREFLWIHDPWSSGCVYVPGQVSGAFEPIVTNTDFHLAIQDPDQFDAPSEFSGDAVFDYIPGYPRIFGIKNPFTIGLDGRWKPDSCAVPGNRTSGRLVSIGPVKCGSLPVPSQGDCGELLEKPCSDSYKMSAARKYKGILATGSADISRYFPTWLTAFLSVGIGTAAIAFQTTDLKGPQLSRAFLFAGLSTSGTVDVNPASAPEKTVGKPVQLSTPGRTWNSDFNQFIDWKFPLPSIAKLVVYGGSNRIDVDAGDAGTISFFGLRCNHGSTRTYRGAIHAVSPVFCRELPYLKIGERKCDEKESCPESVRLAGHRSFTVKVGRATIASLPIRGREYADRYGCAVTAAFVNIQSDDGTKDERIHREFLLIAPNADCRYNVGNGNKMFSKPKKYRLTIGDPDSILSLSDFTGKATLNQDGELRIISGTNSPIEFQLPGAYDPKCMGKRGATGIMVASSVVSCGEAPEPFHDTTPDVSHVEECNAFKMTHMSEVEAAVTKLATGGYDDLYKSGLPPSFIAAVPHDEYMNLLLQPLGTKINNGVFVGLARNPQTGQDTKFVALADFIILARNLDNSLTVKFLTNLCAFDEGGSVVILKPVLCMDAAVQKGDTKKIFPIQHGTLTQKMLDKVISRLRQKFHVAKTVAKTIVETIAKTTKHFAETVAKILPWL